MDSFESLSPLTHTGDLTAAQLLAARLQSEGVDAVVKGEPLGPYPVTVGRMAVTEILVPTTQLDLAKELLAEIESEVAAAEIEPAGVGKSADIRVSALWWLVAALILLFLVWVRLARFL